ncbi:MAG: hypothetical protein ABI828_00115 [Actinomycetota bacterium]
MDIYLEAGDRRVFAGAIAWPGWCRTARDETGAIEALLSYGPRYAGVMSGSGVRPAFAPPKRASSFTVRERLTGDSTTDFGAPSIAPSGDASAMRPPELRRLQAVLRATWDALDRATETAAGVTLARGPRGGGRDLDGILAHVAGAESSYARKIAVRSPDVTADPRASYPALREAVLEGLARAVTEGLPATGPRGGAMWSARYFVRRAAWHVLDHAWEIEDRSGGSG